MTARKKTSAPLRASGRELLETLVDEALGAAKTAKKSNKSLTGDNFYAEKMAQLRADATNAFRDLSMKSPGDVTAVAELIQEVFGPTTKLDRRRELARELLFSLRTTWRDPSTAQSSGDPIFPLGLLEQANRGYLVVIGRQVNACFTDSRYDACAVMMRRLLEIAIIEAFEGKRIPQAIKDGNGEYLHLTDLVGKALGEAKWTLSRNAKKYLPQLRDLGHLSAHGRYFTAQTSDIERVRQGFRVVIEEFLRIADLL